MAHGGRWQARANEAQRHEFQSQTQETRDPQRAEGAAVLTGLGLPYTALFTPVWVPS